MAIDVQHDAERSRYLLFVDSRLAGAADYRITGGAVVFFHTEIPPSMRRRGLAAELVGAALDDVRRSGRSVIARCWYVAQFVRQHPQYADLIAA